MEQSYQAPVSSDCPNKNSLDKCSRASSINGQDDLSKQFIELGATDIETIFISAAESGAIQLLSFLLNRVDEYTIETAAAHACFGGYKKVAKSLYKLSPTQDCANQCLQMSILGGEPRLIKWSLKKGAVPSEDIHWLVGRNIKEVLRKLGQKEVRYSHLFGSASYGSQKDFMFALNNFRPLTKEEKQNVAGSALLNGNINNFKLVSATLEFEDRKEEFLAYAARGGDFDTVSEFLEGNMNVNPSCCLAAAFCHIKICDLLDSYSRGNLSKDVLMYCGFSGDCEVIEFFTDGDKREHKILLCYGCAAGGNSDYLKKYLPDDLSREEVKQLLTEAISHSKMNILRQLTNNLSDKKQLLSEAASGKSLLVHLKSKGEPHMNVLSWIEEQ